MLGSNSESKAQNITNSQKVNLDTIYAEKEMHLYPKTLSTDSEINQCIVDSNIPATLKPFLWLSRGRLILRPSLGKLLLKFGAKWNSFDGYKHRIKIGVGTGTEDPKNQILKAFHEINPHCEIAIFDYVDFEKVTGSEIQMSSCNKYSTPKLKNLQKSLKLQVMLDD
ncbi:MAG: hypothetical protein Sylvanvirus7_13 [Sylvanvirus sp.]|uniref:Uncharacterized protein n=1 Tax=Sylvanvirus sp. TaxID=2487774 RepID=A0A3G5AHN1_9VIRU|nr:MAG: hypothetical protein Sylvanvirus7_13 [Sylvanvirus sp.]